MNLTVKRKIGDIVYTEEAKLSDTRRFCSDAYFTISGVCSIQVIHSDRVSLKPSMGNINNPFFADGGLTYL